MKFTVTTEPAGAAYMNLVKLTPISTPPNILDVSLIVLVSKSLDEGIYIYQVNAWGGTFVMRAAAGGSDAGQISKTVWVF